MAKKLIYLNSERALVKKKKTYSLSFLIIKFEKLEAAVLLQRSVQVPNVVVDFCDHRVVSEALALRDMQYFKKSNTPL